MKITLLTMGTFGDVRPFLALAYGLEERGHIVTLAGPENFYQYVTETYKRPYVSVGLNSQQVLESEEGRRWMASGDSKQFLKQMAKITHDSRFALERDTAAACKDCDLIIAHPLQVYYACMLSEKLNKPLIIANLFPISPATSAFPHFLARTKKLPFGFLNKATYRLVNSVYEKGLREDMNEWRVKLGGSALCEERFIINWSINRFLSFKRSARRLFLGRATGGIHYRYRSMENPHSVCAGARESCTTRRTDGLAGCWPSSDLLRIRQFACAGAAEDDSDGD